MPSSLAIGDFARATHLSVKTLRHYHRLGLLVPAQVDPESRYRRYGTDQIPVAQIIRRFRDLDMPLEQIGDLLQASDVGARNELIGRHLAQLEQSLVKTQSAVASLRDLLQGPGPSLLIQHRRDQAMEVAAVSDRVTLDDLGPWFQGALGEIFATLGAAHAPPAGPAGSIVSNDFFTEEHGDVTVFVPCRVPVRPLGRVRPASLPAVELATIVHAGSHLDIDRAYGSLAAYVTEHALGVDGAIRERYLVGRHDTPAEESWRTEIGWPIFQTAP